MSASLTLKLTLGASHTELKAVRMRKLALVTGGARRIGREISITLANNGYNVLIHANSSVVEAEALCKEIQSSGENGGRRAHVLQANFAAPNAVTNLIQSVKTHHLTIERGGIDALVHNASIYEATPANFYEDLLHKGNNDQLALLDAEISLMRRMAALHMEVPHHLTLGLLAELRSTRGSVVSLTDTSLGRSWPNRNAYTASKAGLQQLMKNLAGELAPLVRCNCVSPGAILPPTDVVEDFESITNRVPMRRAGTPQEISSAVRFLLENEYINGQTLVVDGGLSLR